MSSSAFVVARGQQVVSLFLTTIPLAERMLLYHVAMTAWIMLPERRKFSAYHPGAKTDSF